MDLERDHHVREASALYVVFAKRSCVRDGVSGRGLAGWGIACNYSQSPRIDIAGEYDVLNCACRVVVQGPWGAASGEGPLSRLLCPGCVEELAGIKTTIELIQSSKCDNVLRSKMTYGARNMKPHLYTAGIFHLYPGCECLDLNVPDDII